MAFAIVEDALTDPRVIGLITEHLRHMHALGPPENVHALPIEGLRAADVTLWTLWEGDALLGCGALKALGGDHGEVKSMRTAPAALRRGVASAVLDHIVVVARARGYHRLSLETGSAPPFLPAVRLYQRHGFDFCPPFADYRDEPSSVYMTRCL